MERKFDLFIRGVCSAVLREPVACQQAPQAATLVVDLLEMRFACKKILDAECVFSVATGNKAAFTVATNAKTINAWHRLASKLRLELLETRRL